MGELDLFKGLGVEKLVEQRNPEGRTDRKETKQVQSTGPDPSWMQGARERKETHISLSRRTIPVPSTKGMKAR